MDIRDKSLLINGKPSFFPHLCDNWDLLLRGKEASHYAELTRRLRESLRDQPIVGLMEGGYIADVDYSQGYYRELINSDAREYGGSGVGNRGGVHAEAVAWHGRPASLVLELPPLGVLYLTPSENS